MTTARKPARRWSALLLRRLWALRLQSELQPVRRRACSGRLSIAVGLKCRCLKARAGFCSKSAASRPCAMAVLQGHMCV